jgi:hypothetical protein
VHWGCYYATALDIEVDPQRRRFGCRESDFALQRLVECRALETKPSDCVAMTFQLRAVFSSWLLKILAAGRLAEIETLGDAVSRPLLVRAKILLWLEDKSLDLRTT